ncbi:hypothetical protein A2U01_0001388, partial [Trifolium medium]|nr:hypothetical protein [Trifolium medium]
AQAVLQKIEGIWMGFYKLRANISKFKRGDGGVERVEHQIELFREDQPRPKDGLSKGVSFKAALGVNEEIAVLKPGVQNAGYSRLKSKGQGIDKNYLDSVLEVEAVPANVEKLKHSFVGTLWQANMAESIQMMINMEGFQDITATLLGIDKILLSSAKDEGVKQAVEADSQWWKRVFTDIKPWSTIQKPRGRRIWTERQERLDVARAQIAVTSWDFVDEVTEIKVNEELFVIRVVEERFGEIDLGVKRGVDSQNFSDGSTKEDYRLDSHEVNGDMVDEVEGRVVEEEWEGCSDGGSGEIQKTGPCLEDIGTTSDTLAKGTTDRTKSSKVIETVELNRGEVVEKRRVQREGGDFIRDDNSFVALSEVEYEEVGEFQPTTPILVLSAAQDVTEKEKGLARSLVEGEKGVGSGYFNSNHVENGPKGLADLGLCVDVAAVLDKGKNKLIVSEEGEMAMKYRSLIKGGCSSKINGPVGLEEVLEVENHGVRILNNREVAQLEAYELSLAHKNNIIGSNFLKAKKQKNVGGGSSTGTNSLLSGMTRTGRFVRAVHEGAKVKANKKDNNKRKGRTKTRQVVESEESISDVSLTQVTGTNSLHRHTVPVSALAVVLVEGEENDINDVVNKQYRIEAERLFNIGLNMGVTTNADRISMMERLIDSEKKEVDIIEAWEDEEVDQ